jgi:hypothetical protein
MVTVRGNVISVVGDALRGRPVVLCLSRLISIISAGEAPTTKTSTLSSSAR